MDIYSTLLFALAAAGLHYDLSFTAELDPASGTAAVEIAVEQSERLLSRVELVLDLDRYTNFSADGSLEVDDGRVTWQPPTKGGRLRYRHRIEHARGDGYDAHITDTWAMLRAEDLFPPAKVRARKGATARSSLKLQAPEDWSIETPWGPAVGKTIAIDNPGRRFDRPTGWIIGGDLGVRRETIASRRVAVAATQDQGLRRNDILAFLNWNLPAVVGVFPDFPKRLLIVGAGEGAWRGALSGPSSVYLHAERPLVSENGTSTLLHELIHVAMRKVAATDDDWIVEGLAEYYSIELMRRTGTITRARFDHTLEALRSWSFEADQLRSSRSSGATTARAALFFYELNNEISTATDMRYNLDKLVQALVTSNNDLSLNQLDLVTRSILARPSTTLSAWETVICGGPCQ